MLRKIAVTAITGKGAESAKEKLADISVKAVKRVCETQNGKLFFDRENIKLEKKVGGAVEETELIEGIVLEKEAVHPGMPRLL